MLEYISLHIRVYANRVTKYRAQLIPYHLKIVYDRETIIFTRRTLLAEYPNTQSRLVQVIEL